MHSIPQAAASQLPVLAKEHSGTWHWQEKKNCHHLFGEEFGNVRAHRLRWLIVTVKLREIWNHRGNKSLATSRVIS